MSNMSFDIVYSVELDCPPGNPRPDDLIDGVLEGTGLTTEDFEKPTAFFGNWEWVLKKTSDKDVFVRAKPTLAKRITELYHQGCIRYGSW